MSAHLDLNRLARLADGDWSGLSPAERRHLSVCRECQDAVIEATAMATECSHRPVAPALAMEQCVIARTSGRPAAAGWRWRRPVLVGLPAAAVLALALLTWQPGAPMLDRTLTDPIDVVLAERSASAMVFPGVSAPTTTDAGFRGESGDGPRLQEALQGLTRAYNDHPDQPDIACWLLGGYLALDDLHTAHLFARDAVRRHPDHVDLLSAAAIVAFRRGDLDQADRLLGRARARAPERSDLRFNAAILSAAGRLTRPGLEDLRGLDHAADAATAARVRRLREQQSQLR